MDGKVIGEIYNTVPHPPAPASYLGPDNWFCQADGGENNLEQYDMGRGGRPYACSVQGKAGLPRSSLPKPELMFDSLLKRNKVRSVRFCLFLVCLHNLIIQIRNHAGGMSSLIFAFVMVVTHSLFHSGLDKRENFYINKASFYLDLSPLYGKGALFASVRSLKANNSIIRNHKCRQSNPRQSS